MDASWAEQQQNGNWVGVGGWGLVLLVPGQMPQRYQGQLQAPDNNAAELRAVQEAVRHAPAAQPLHIFTDNQAVLAAVGRGRGPALLAEAAHTVQHLAAERAVTLRLSYAPRTRRHMVSAHELSNDARKGILSDLRSEWAEIVIEQRPGWSTARIRLRRQSERVAQELPLEPLSVVPPSAQALLAALRLVQPGEKVQIRRASKLAQALWLSPARALREQALTQLSQARAQADAAGIVVEFIGVG